MIFSNRLKNLTPYIAGEQPQDKRYIKLNTNENPYPPCPEINNYLKNILDYNDLRLYPDNTARELKETLAEYHTVKPENIFIGNGSDEVLSLAFYAFFDNSQVLLFPEITYSFYPVYAEYFQLQYQTIPVDDSFQFKLEDFLQNSTQSIIFPNPNATTASGFNFADIHNFLKNVPDSSPVIIDEAYIDFGLETAIPLVNKFKNLLIVRTFSKSASLAGMRIGYAVGNMNLISSLETVKDSFNSYPVNRISQKCAVLAIQNWNYSLKNIKTIIATRNYLIQELRNLNWKVIESNANFIFASPPNGNAESMYKQLKDTGILVRFFNKPRLDKFLRITIGTKSDIDFLLKTVTSMQG